MNSYTHRAYAESLREHGRPRRLAGSGTWLLERPIPQSRHRDAMGCYPLLCCEDWSALGRDLAELQNELVAVSAVVDPFGAYRQSDLKRAFPDLVRPFKEHFIADLHRPICDRLSRSHRYNVKQALKCVDVEVCKDSGEARDDWLSLYADLVARHGVTGFSAFSETALKAQLAVPGITIMRARRDDETVAMSLWAIAGEVVYYHLSASSDVGYRLRAGFAMLWSAIEYFSDRGSRWMNLGAGSGVVGDVTDGLSEFKRGWSTGTRTAYLCGRILDPAQYQALACGRHCAEDDYFPAYRAGEFSS